MKDQEFLLLVFLFKLCSEYLEADTVSKSLTEQIYHELKKLERKLDNVLVGITDKQDDITSMLRSILAIQEATINKADSIIERLDRINSLTSEFNKVEQESRATLALIES